MRHPITPSRISTEGLQQLIWVASCLYRASLVAQLGPAPAATSTAPQSSPPIQRREPQNDSASSPLGFDFLYPSLAHRRTSNAPTSRLGASLPKLGSSSLLPSQRTGFASTSSSSLSQRRFASTSSSVTIDELDETITYSQPDLDQEHEDSFIDPPRRRPSYRKFNPYHARHATASFELRRPIRPGSSEHWSLPLDKTPSREPFHSDPAFADLRETMDSFATSITQSSATGSTRLALAHAAANLWDSYTRVCSLQRFPVRERLKVARQLVSTIRRIRARKHLTDNLVKSTSALGEMVAAISSDCDVIGQFEDSDSPHDVGTSGEVSHEADASPAQNFRLVNLKAQAHALMGNEDLAVRLVAPLLEDHQDALLSYLREGDPPLRNRLPAGHSDSLSDTFVTIFDAMLVSAHQASDRRHARNMAARKCLKQVHQLPQILAIVRASAHVGRRFTNLTRCLADPIASLDRTLGPGDWSHFALSLEATHVMLAFAHSDTVRIAINIYKHASRRGARIPEGAVGNLLLLSSWREDPATTADLLNHIRARARSEARIEHRPKAQLPVPILATSAMFWARQGNTERMEAALKEIEAQESAEGYLDKLSFSAQLECASSRGDVKSCLAMFGTERDLDENFFDSLLSGPSSRLAQFVLAFLRACNNSDDANSATELWRLTLKKGVVPSILACNAILELFSRKGDVDMALQILEKMRELKVYPDKYSYANLVNAFAVRRDAEGAAYAVKAMIADGITPDVVAYNALMNAYVETSAWDAATGLFRWMRNNRDPSLRPNTATCNTLIKIYIARKAPVQTVMQTVANMNKLGIRNNDRTIALMLQSACDAGIMDLAEEIFTEAEEILTPPSGLSKGQGATAFHFSIMIHGYLRRGENDHAKSYFEEMQRRGIQPDAVTWSSIVSSYAKSDSESNFELAKALVESLMNDTQSSLRRENSSWRVPAVKRGVSKEILFLPLVLAHARRQEPTEAHDAAEPILALNSQSSLYTLSSLIHAYGQVGQIDEAIDLFEELYDLVLRRTNVDVTQLFADRPQEDDDTTEAEENKGRQVDPARRNILCVPMSMMIQILSKAGQHEMIARLWARAKEDGFAFDSHNWNHLACAMAQGGQLNAALTVIDRVLNEPTPNFSLGLFPGYSSSAPEDRFAQEQDPLSMEGLFPAHLYKGLDLTISPMDPPNRRDQQRYGDDPETRSPPLEVSLTHEADEQGESMVTSADVDEWEAAPVRKRGSGIDLTAPVSGIRDAEVAWTPWYAHFETLEAVRDALGRLRETGMDGERKVRMLLLSHPDAARILSIHEAKVERIEEIQRRNSGIDEYRMM